MSKEEKSSFLYPNNVPYFLGTDRSTCPSNSHTDCRACIAGRRSLEEDSNVDKNIVCMWIKGVYRAAERAVIRGATEQD